MIWLKDQITHIHLLTFLVIIVTLVCVLRYDCI